MLDSIRSRIRRKWFRFATRGIFGTKQVTCNANSNVVILSQLYPPDLTMYLLAAKSFSRFLQPREFVVIDDNLSKQDKEVLQKHFERIRFVPISDVKSQYCPQGGTWERLLSIAALNSGDYVIQLDADTLTLSSPDEVLQCVANNRSFTLGTSSGKEVISLPQASQFAMRHISDHVQIQAELALGNYPDDIGLCYVRGCSGFAGFAAGYLTRRMVEEFSSNMTKLLGAEKWGEWGSEQVSSNFLVANSPGALILPVNAYPFWAPGVDAGRAKLIHFVGTHRYYAGKYAALARSIIDQLS